MKKLLKALGIALGGVVLCVAGIGIYVYAVAGHKLSAKRTVPETSFRNAAYKPDLARGKYIVETRLACTFCHGADLAGAKVMDSVPTGRIYGSNITPSGLADWSDAEIVRALRNGVGKDGRALILMPSQDYQYLSEPEIRDIVAYLRSVPPVEKPSVACTLGPVFKALVALDKTPSLLPVQIASHKAEFPAEVPEGVTPEYGKYLAHSTCMGCHGENLKGGPIPGGDPSWPPAANITQDALAVWSEDDFIRTLRTGAKPTGEMLRPPMIVTYTAKFKENDLKAIWAYLVTVKGSEDFAQ